MAESARVAISEGAEPASRSQATTGLRILFSQRLLWLLILVGVALRIRQYAIDRSLWMDESFVALNILGRGVRKLLSVPLDFNQAVPAGFLVVEKLSTQAFGKSEYSLRVLPLVCGVAAIPLFVSVARRTLSSLALPFAVGLFAVSGSLVYYSSELKPYSVDVLAALAIYVMSFAALQRRLTVVRALFFGLAGAVLILVSYAAIFVAAGCGVVVLGVLLLDRHFDWIRPALLVAGLWALGAILFLVFSIFSFKSYTGLVDAGVSFSGGRPFWYGPIHWCWTRVREVAIACGFYGPLSSPLVIVSLLAATLAIVGAVEFFFRRRRDFALLIAPILVTLSVSAVGRFPIAARSILFVTPLVFLFVANGAVTLLRRLRGWTVPALVALFAVLVVGTASFGAGTADPFASVRPNEIKTSLSYIVGHWRKGDVLYVHYATQYAFGYYLQCDCFSPSGRPDMHSLWSVQRIAVADHGEQFPRAFASRSPRLIIGTPAWQTSGSDFEADVDRIRSHQRAWILVTWTFSAGERDFMRRRLFAPLDRRGKETASIAGRGTHLYLYTFGSS
jgi:hypothetical protein